MEHLHLRFTPYDISGYSFDFLDNYEQYACFQEDVDDDGNPLLHYHIYIQEVNDCEKTLRNAITANLKIPTVGRGQTNKFYALIKSWEDPDYIFKYGNEVRSKGYSEKEILDRIASGRKKYLSKVKPSVQDGNTIIYEVASKKVTRVNLNRQIIADLNEYYLDRIKELRPLGKSPTYKELVSKCIDLVKGHGRGINKYQIRDFVTEVLCEDERSKEKIVEKICESIL